MMYGSGQVISFALGWLSTIAWSISFYPQALLNYRRKSVQGLSFDFVYLNVEGFLAYSIYNIAMFASPVVREEYRRRNYGHDPSVRGNDIAFAVHAFILSVLTLGQTFIFKRDPGQSISSSAATFISMSTIVILTATFGGVAKSIAWLDVLYYLSYLKLAISFVKLVPQAYMNFKRKSTVGWSIHNILLDFTGGFCSLAQLLLDAQINNDWGSLRGNPAKLILGVLAMSFDVVFMLQHYVLYRNSNSDLTAGGDADDDSSPNERTRLV